MSKYRGGDSRKAESCPPSRRPTIYIPENHRLVQLAERINWEEMAVRAESIRASKLKNAAGRPPQLRALLGALVLRATRKMSYRELEDQVRYYAPARYLCGLTESGWTPDHNTLHDFVELMGEEGVRFLNECVVEKAVEEGLANARVVVGDTTVQEAAIPHPNEMGLMAAFMGSVVAASKKAGAALKGFAAQVAPQLKAAKKKTRSYRLFAKTKAAKGKLLKEMTRLVEATQAQLAPALEAMRAGKGRVRKYGKVAHSKVMRLHETMKKLLPQIRYWLKTGRVAKDKIISLHIPRLYSIVRGKVGKSVEFGLRWGITRLKGGFLLATLGQHRRELVDSKFAVRAVDDCIGLFGKAPRDYAYDRGGYSQPNVAKLKKKGVKQVGLAPRGRAKWEVSGKAKERLIKERARVEGGIGTIKSNRYGFNRPTAHSTEMMGAYGQLAVLGFNLNKLIRGMAEEADIELVG